MVETRRWRWSEMGRGLLAASVVVLGSCAIGDAEARAGEARAIVVRYLEALGGAEPDRGWSILNAPMRSGYPEDRYLRVASRAAGPPPIDEIELTHEDDGIYAFTVSYDGEMDQAYAQVLFTASVRASPIACPNGSDTFEVAVIVGDGEFAGISANSCLDGQIPDPREPAG